MTDFYKFEKRNAKAPHHAIGDVLNHLTIVKILEHGKRHTIKNQWWYEVKCQCGNIEILNQDQLKTRIDCIECQTDRKIRTVQAKFRTMSTPEGVPDFARMKL